MRTLKLICLSAILLPFNGFSAEARTIETTTNNIKNQHLSVSKVDFIKENQWETEANLLLAQGAERPTNDARNVADGSWSNSEEEAEKTPSEVIFNLQQIGRRDFSPNRGAPGFTLANPYGFGADGGNAYVGIGFTPNSRFGGDDPDGVIGFGVGVGSARKAVGLELNYTMAGFGENRDFGTGGFSAKLHRNLGTGWGIAAGWNGFVNLGDDNDFQDSLYLATTKIFSTRENLNSAFSRVAVTMGVGNGQFRTEDSIENDEENFNVFGSLAFRIARPVSGVVEWTGQDLAVGTSISPFKSVPVTFNLGLRDIVGAGDGARFVLGVGAGF